MFLVNNNPRHGFFFSEADAAKYIAQLETQEAAKIQQRIETDALLSELRIKHG